jgi:Uma2 family endonuclease
VRNGGRDPTIRYVATDSEIRLEQVHRLGVEDYHRLIESGGLAEDERVELIDGLILEMSPRTKAHEQGIRWLTRWLYGSVDTTAFEIGVASSLTLEESEPEPDLVVFASDAPRPYHPGSAELVIEVSVSSLGRDLVVKHRLYARAGVKEYWVVDVEGRRVVRHLEPGRDGYARVDEVREGQALVATAIALPPLDLGELFAATHA